MTTSHNSVKESLSALFDGEHSELDLRRVLKAAQTDDEVANSWHGYTLTRQVLQKQRVYPERSLLDGVREALADEPAPERQSKPSTWQQWAGKAAVAAVVSFGFLFGASQWQFNAEQGNTFAANDNAAVVPTGFELPPLQARTVSTDAADQIPANYIQMQSREALNQQLLQNPELRAQLYRLMLKQAEVSAAEQAAGGR